MQQTEHIEFRDPVHGFINIRPLERKIIDSKPFQRLRGIKQLALTNLVYHGAEHTRFGHSIGVMHLVTRAFNSVVEKNPDLFAEARIKWYEQILRLIALIHDLGHAPFSHGSELVFPDNLKHEEYTEKIILGTKIAEYINEIGAEFAKSYGEEYNITPELICSVYRGNNIDNPDFIFLRKFMDSELDCDKMDYLLRDSLYCGVNYGKYDLDRLILCLTAYKEGNNIFLAMDEGGIHAFEEFVLARYFMFTQVYFHKTRRFLDKMLVKYLERCLPNGKYPSDVNDFLDWDDARVWGDIKKDADKDEVANRLYNRKIMKTVYESPTHTVNQDVRIYNFIRSKLEDEFGKDKLLCDSADSMVHKIPQAYEIDNERVIPIIRSSADVPTTIYAESVIINRLTDPINIKRIYADESIKDDAREYVNKMMKDMARGD
jgi:hypothetical protein